MQREMIVFTSSDLPARRKHLTVTIKSKAKSKVRTSSSRAQQQSQYASRSQSLPPAPVTRVADPPPPYSLIAPNENPPSLSPPYVPPSRLPLRPLPPPARAPQPSFNDQRAPYAYRTNSTDAVPKPPAIESRQWPAQAPSCPVQDMITKKLCAVLTSIDCESFGGDENDLLIHEPSNTALRGGWGFSNRDVSRTANNAVSSVVKNPRSTNYFAKVNLYANSRLPPYLPPLNLYLPSYPLICVATQYSQQVYMKPTGKEREAHVDADLRLGTKAMVIKSIPLDDRNVVVFAIRGSQTFMDWAVNLKSEPASPMDFLDDPGNMCHSGFLSVARKMIKPVAARLRSLIEEDPSRAGCSLVLTGHSAGGAVASLLFSHMLAEIVRSELNILTGCFKRIHCITFGAPPVSLLPLTKSRSPRHQKSLFLSFINEGDPVPRADRAYVRSLIQLYASPAPGGSCLSSLLPSAAAPRCKLTARIRSHPPASYQNPAMTAPEWPVPPGTLSNAGKLVVLRVRENTPEDSVTAEVTSDEQLRRVVFGDPIMHMMKVYARRVELLATKAVTAKIWA